MLRLLSFAVLLIVCSIAAGASDLQRIVSGTHSCVEIPIACNSSYSGALTAGHDCFITGANVYADGLTFLGLSGVEVEIAMNSTAFDPLLILGDSDANVVADDDDSGPGLNALIQATLPKDDEYLIVATSAFSFQTGPYTLELSCSSSGGSCIPSATAMCLNNNRFRVSATFLTPGGQSGNGQVVKLTEDTGYLWFFSATNVEVVVKVLNACGLNNRYWVFAGGLTNVNTIITVTDTQTGTTKTYTNPQSTPFQPIQDTGALPTCP